MVTFDVIKPQNQEREADTNFWSCWILRNADARNVYLSTSSLTFFNIKHNVYENYCVNICFI